MIIIMIAIMLMIIMIIIVIIKIIIYIIYIPLKGSSQNKAFMVRVEFTLPFPSMLCLFEVENTVKELPRPIAT